MSADHPAAYDGAREALTELRRVTALRQALIDAAARAFFFEYLRQPQAARLFTALDDLEGVRYIGPAGYRRAAEILNDLQNASHALQLLDGDPGEWLKTPLAQLDEHLKETLPRMEARAAMTSGLMGQHFSDRYEAEFAVDTVRQALHRLTRTWGGRTDTSLSVSPDDLPGPGAAASSDDCRNSARRVDAFVQKARAIPSGAVTDPGARNRLQYLIDLGTEVSNRFTATACLLQDARELGGARRLLASLEAAEVTEAGDLLTVQVPPRSAGTVRRGRDGRWTFTGGPHAYASPEGAVAALLRLT
ncbi:hypothetical protein [Streptomyces sp. bgisy153]|uniref:hypothetical protein n=1 Tax=Streptomyces sp. bgisy153 TaxID=3413793 RepID=UPI003D761E25